MLTAIIRDLQAGLNAFNSTSHPTNEESDAHAAATFHGPLERLRAFDGAATSLDEASLALDLAESELASGDHETAAVLIKAVKLYLVEVAHG